MGRMTFRRFGCARKATYPRPGEYGDQVKAAVAGVPGMGPAGRRKTYGQTRAAATFRCSVTGLAEHG
jgi:hypothetical protein